MKCLQTNMRGFHSKKETLEEIVNTNNVKIVIVNETHCNDSNPPKIKNFSTYSRQRIGKRMGGVAVLVHKSIDVGAVKVDVGEEDLEYVAVKLESFSPPLLIFSYYGQQENQHSAE